MTKVRICDTTLYAPSPCTTSRHARLRRLEETSGRIVELQERELKIQGVRDTSRRARGRFFPAAGAALADEDAKVFF